MGAKPGRASTPLPVCHQTPAPRRRLDPYLQVSAAVTAASCANGILFGVRKLRACANACGKKHGCGYFVPVDSKKTKHNRRNGVPMHSKSCLILTDASGQQNQPSHPIPDLSKL